MAGFELVSNEYEKNLSILNSNLKTISIHNTGEPYRTLLFLRLGHME